MKNILLILSLSVQFLFAQQNLVPNPSFEEYTGCPDDAYQMNYVVYWKTYRSSPDFYTACGTSIPAEHPFSFSTPSNGAGYQVPASGNSYLGLIFYSAGQIKSNEMVGCDLVEPLQIGVRYYVSFKVAWTYIGWIRTSYGANNKIGAKFISDAYTPPPNSDVLIDNYAHIYTDSVVSDSVNWTQIYGSFVADSAYKQIVIGGFFDNQHVSINVVDPLGSHNYYFLDDVCVSTDSQYCRSYSYPLGIPENLPINFQVFPNPVADYLIISNNSSISQYNVEIYNALGQIAFGETGVVEKKKTIPTNTLSSGVYTAVIKSGIHFFTHKILKQ